MPFKSIFRAARAFLTRRGDNPTPYPGVPFRDQFQPPVTHDHPSNNYPSDPPGPEIAPRIPHPAPRCAGSRDGGCISPLSPCIQTCGAKGPPAPQVPRPCNVIRNSAASWCGTCGREWGADGPTVCGYRHGAPGGERFPDKVPPRLLTRLVTEDDARLIDEARAIRDAGGTPAVVNWDMV